MRIALVTHDISLEHDTGWGHPERPARVPAVIDGVRGAGFPVVELTAPPAERADISRIHDGGYIDAIEQFCASGGGALDADTVAKSASWEAALRSAGAGLAAVDALERDAADVGFVVMRPPGHHALPSRAMGFCLFNNVAVAAAHLADAGHRVAIVDWDVHHGNGTQDVFYDDDRVLYISMHEYPAYPGTGSAGELGAGAAIGSTINIPWPPGTDGAAYRWAMDAVIRPVLDQFAPDWLLVSAGYDAHAADPLAGIMLTADDYWFMASRLRGVVPERRTVFFLEGGYDLDALRESSAATLGGWHAGSDTGAADAASAPADATSAGAMSRGAAHVAAGVVDAVRRRWDVAPFDSEPRGEGTLPPHAL